MLNDPGPSPATRRRRPALLLLLLLAVLAECLDASPAVAAGVSGGLRAGTTQEPPAVVLSRGPRDRKVVALTFDDGYNPTTCGALVDLLTETETPATFFPNSVNVVGAPTLWRRVASLGYPIGNHTATHPYLPVLTYQQQWSEITSDRVALERVIGEQSLSVFRPPYGAYSPETLVAAHAAGYGIVLNWDTTFADSSRRPNGQPWPLASYVRAASRGTNGSVVLGHCGSPIDLAALPAVITSYRARGFTFITVPQLLGLPGAAPMHFTAPRPTRPRTGSTPL